MPTKTNKTVKKAPAKKPAKKVVKPAAVAKPVVTEIPLPDPYCHCTKRKRNTILTCVSITAFSLGLLTYHLFFCPSRPHFPLRPQFVNGCVDVTSIHCPKLLNDLQMIDADHDGCVTKSEMRAAKKAMHRNGHPMPKEPDVNVNDAIAPVMD